MPRQRSFKKAAEPCKNPDATRSTRYRGVEAVHPRQPQEAANQLLKASKSTPAPKGQQKKAPDVNPGQGRIDTRVPSGTALRLLKTIEAQTTEHPCGNP